MKNNSTNTLIIGGSVLVGIGTVNLIFWLLSVEELGLINVFSAILTACIATSWTRKSMANK